MLLSKNHFYVNQINPIKQAKLFLTFGLCASFCISTVASDSVDTTRILVDKLTLNSYKSTLKGLTQFGDRRQGTVRNRDALSWIEQQLVEMGCDNLERMSFSYNPEPRAPRVRKPITNQADQLKTLTGGAVGRNGVGLGGASIYDYRAETGVNREALAQSDERIRLLNAEQPVNGERQQVYCTKIGISHPDEMYIVGAHFDGHGVNEAVDDGSGTALVMELARVLNGPGVTTKRSIRFALWNNEETGLNGSKAYVQQRQKLQGIESPAGSGKFPEPRWLGMIQHDMML
jgi:hypothetical protein